MGKKSISIFGIFLFLLLFFSGTQGHADVGSGANYSVSPIYPDNQQNGESGFFDLKVNPNETETLKVKIKNYSDSENVIHIKASRATTSDGGVISYKEFDKEKDSGLVYDFTEFVHIEHDTVTIPPSGEIDIDITLTIPNETFDGVIVGGLHFYQDAEKTKNNKNTAVINTFSYSLPVLLRETDTSVVNQFELLSVKSNLRNYHTYIEATIDNNAPIIVREMVIDGKITKKNSDKSLYERTETTYQMAPNSTLNFGFDLQDTQLKAGMYTTYISIEVAGQNFDLEKDFEITAEEAKKLNKEAIYIDDPNDSHIFVYIIIIFVILLCSIVFLIFKHRKKSKNNK